MHYEDRQDFYVDGAYVGERRNSYNRSNEAGPESHVHIKVNKSHLHKVEKKMEARFLRKLETECVQGNRV